MIEGQIEAIHFKKILTLFPAKVTSRLPGNLPGSLFLPLPGEEERLWERGCFNQKLIKGCDLTYESHTKNSQYRKTPQCNAMWANSQNWYKYCFRTTKTLYSSHPNFYCSPSRGDIKGQFNTSVGRIRNFTISVQSGIVHFHTNTKTTVLHIKFSSFCHNTLYTDATY